MLQLFKANKSGPKRVTINIPGEEEKKEADKAAKKLAKKKQKQAAEAKRDQQFAAMQAQQQQLLLQQQQLLHQQPRPVSGQSYSQYQATFQTAPRPPQVPQSWAHVVNNGHQQPAAAIPQPFSWPTNIPQTQAHPTPNQNQQPSPAVQAVSPQLAGEMIVPAVVVFRNMEPDAMKTIVTQVAPLLAPHIVSVTQEQGAKASRIVLHCRTRHIEQVHTIIPLLEAKDMPTQAYIARKSQQAAQGLQNATSNAGICHYFAANQNCPFYGKCKYKCYQ